MNASNKTPETLFCFLIFVLLFMHNKNNLFRFKVEKNKIYETGGKKQNEIYLTPSFAITHTVI